jgi:hypothetical protein
MAIVKDEIQRAQPEAKDALKGRPAAQGAVLSGPAIVAAWVVFSAFCSCAGWVLSALHQLNAAGYAVTFLLGLAVVWTLRERLLPGNIRGWNLRKQRRRFRRAFPLAFLILASLAILGGAIYPPSNYDALAYRIPRVLHWLAEGRWHWIYTDFQRVNTRACGIEWLSAPLIVFTRTDRWLFLINSVSFLLLPGLVFSLFRRVGVRSRVAWHWMWLLPTGYCYLLQAGSAANDMFSTVYALAAVDFALRARKSARVSEVCLSLLSAALLTGAKASNLPLLLPWAVALAPTWRVWLARPLAVGAMLGAAAGASFLPTAVLNTLHCGDWTGTTIEQMSIGAGPAWLGVFVSSVTWTLNNVAPPVFPLASAWNRAAEAITPAPLALLLQKHFEAGLAHLRLPEIQMEESSGLGFGVTILLGLSLLAVALKRRRRDRAQAALSGDRVARLVCIAPWLSLLYAMTKLNLTGAVRLLAPYYPLLGMGLLLSPAQAGLVRRGWWRWWAFFSFGLAGLLLVISPARPLWPTGWFFQHYGARLQSSKLAARARDAYVTKSKRTEVFAPVIASLPADAFVLGYYADDFPETSLWKPFGSRRILHVKANDSGEEIRQRGIKYLLVTTRHLKESWPEWLRRMNARELQTVALKMWGSLPPFVWHLVELNPPPIQSGPK